MKKSLSQKELLEKISQDNENLKQEVFLLRDFVEKQKPQVSQSRLKKLVDDVSKEKQENQYKIISVLPQNIRELIEQKNEKIAFLENESTKLLSEKLSLKQEIDKLNSEISGMQNYFKRLQDELSKKDTQKEKETSHVFMQKTLLESSLENKNDEIVFLKKEQGKIHSDRLALKKENDDLKLEIEKIKTTMLKERQKFIERIQDLEKIHSSILMEKELAKSMLNQKDEDIIDLNKKVADLQYEKQEALVDKENSISKVKKQIQDVSKEKLPFIDKIKEMEKLISNLQTDRDRLRTIVNKKDDEILALKDEFTKIHTERLSLKQDADNANLDSRRLSSQIKLLTKKIEDMHLDSTNIKAQYDSLLLNNMNELKQRDEKILLLGQEMISFKNKVNEQQIQINDLKIKLQIEKDRVLPLKEHIHSLNMIVLKKEEEIKSQKEPLEKELESYKQMLDNLKKSNSELVADVKKFSEQANAHRIKYEEYIKKSLKKDEEKTLETAGKEDLSIKMYHQTKEIEILKQTILELTHKLKTRRVEEAQILAEKNKEFDEKMRDLTEAHSKRELELEYQIQEIKTENQGLKTDINLIKEREKQLLENIKNQFNSIL